MSTKPSREPRAGAACTSVNSSGQLHLAAAYKQGDRKPIKPSIEHRPRAPAQGPSTSTFTTVSSYQQRTDLSTDKPPPKLRLAAISYAQLCHIWFTISALFNTRRIPEYHHLICIYRSSILPYHMLLQRFTSKRPGSIHPPAVGRETATQVSGGDSVNLPQAVRPRQLSFDPEFVEGVARPWSVH